MVFAKVSILFLRLFFFQMSLLLFRVENYYLLLLRLICKTMHLEGEIVVTRDTLLFCLGFYF